MNPPEKPSDEGLAGKQGSGVSRIRRLFSFRILWRVCLIFVLFILAFYAEENWRGHRAWTKYVQEKTALGLHLDWKSCFPPQVPDAENFAMTPILADLFDIKTSARTDEEPHSSGTINNLISAIDKKNLDFADGNWMLGRHTSLSGFLTNHAEWGVRIRKRYGLVDSTRGQAAESKKIDELIQRYGKLTNKEQAQEILQSMETIKPVWDELRSAMKRPYCRYPVKYDEEVSKIRRPHHRAIPKLASLLRMSAICHLELGHADAALADLELGFYLSNSLKTEPWTGSYSTRYTTDHLLTQAIWEGTSRHQWSIVELERLQKLRTNTNEIVEGSRILMCQRAISAATIDEERRQFLHNRFNWEQWKFNGTYLELPYVISCQWGPQGWVDWEKLNQCQSYDEIVPRVFNLSSGIVSTNEIAFLRAIAWWDSPVRYHAFWYHKLYLPHSVLTITSMARQVAREQTTVDLAYLGCALERHYLEKKEYPISLDDLMPRYVAKMPHDVLTGDPYRYRLVDQEHYVLYSIGLNGKDDGGTAHYDPKRESSIDDGDWIWLGGSAGL